MTRDVRITIGTTGSLLLLAGLLVLILPGANVVPWALLFFAVGAGLSVGALASANTAATKEFEERSGNGKQS
jgi:hypothetical protein